MTPNDEQAPKVQCTDHSDLRRLAEAATPGPWHPGHLGGDGKCQCRSIVDEGYAGGIASVHVSNGISLVSEGGNDAPPISEAAANMHYIAAANPARILALLDEVEALKSLLQCAEDGRQEQLANLKDLALRALKGPTHE